MSMTPSCSKVFDLEYIICSMSVKNGFGCHVIHAVRFRFSWKWNLGVPRASEFVDTGEHSPVMYVSKQTSTNLQHGPSLRCASHKRICVPMVSSTKRTWVAECPWCHERMTAYLLQKPDSMERRVRVPCRYAEALDLQAYCKVCRGIVPDAGDHHDTDVGTLQQLSEHLAKRFN